MRNITLHKIEVRIIESKKGQIFIISDFMDIASYDTVRKSLSRLVKDGKLIRVIRGIYKKPNFNELLRIEVPVAPDDLARAIARSNNWTIGPKGDAALNILGLTTQVPAVYHYISDGPSKKVLYEGVSIEFHKRSNKTVSGYSYKTILIIESIRTIGPEHIDQNVRKIILKKCNVQDLKSLYEDGKRTNKWIQEEIKKILVMGGYNYAQDSITF